ncbi:MAG: hypothetical protein Q9159_006115 [Coniocarpon cinnabarinum]
MSKRLWYAPTIPEVDEPSDDDTVVMPKRPLSESEIAKEYESAEKQTVIMSKRPWYEQTTHEKDESTDEDTFVMICNRHHPIFEESLAVYARNLGKPGIGPFDKDSPPHDCLWKFNKRPGDKLTDEEASKLGLHDINRTLDSANKDKLQQHVEELQSRKHTYIGKVVVYHISEDWLGLIFLTDVEIYEEGFALMRRPRR